MYGEATQALDDATKKRCRVWIEGLGRIVEGNGSVAKCEACGKEGHLSADYESLRLDLTHSHISESTKKGPQAFGHAGTLRCEVCGSLSHRTVVCTLLKLYKERGESASIPSEAKERCRARVQAEERGVGRRRRFSSAWYAREQITFKTPAVF